MRIALLVMLFTLMSLGVASAATSWDTWTPGTDTSTYVQMENPYYSGICVYTGAPSYSWSDGVGAYGTDVFSVTADIELYVEIYFSAMDVRFHIASDTGDMSAIVPGWIAGNSGEAVFISKSPDLVPPEEMYNLSQISTVYGTVDDPDIPVTWDYRKAPRGTGAWTDWAPLTPSVGGNNGQLWGLYFPVDKSYWDFEVRVTIHPAEHQEDGRYVLDPFVAASPIL